MASKGLNSNVQCLLLLFFYLFLNHNAIYSHFTVCLKNVNGTKYNLPATTWLCNVYVKLTLPAFQFAVTVIYPHYLCLIFASSIYVFVGTSDPYVKFKIAGKEVFRSKTIHKNLNPVWDERVSLVVETLRDPLYVKVNTSIYYF